MPATATRPRLSDEFLKENARRRVLAGTAKAIARSGYCAATVADIVRTCRTARNTFYNCFGSKEDAALAMVAELGVELEDLSEHPAVDVLAIELAALWHDGQHGAAREAAVLANRVVRTFAECELIPPPPSDDPLHHRIPSGRHNLPPEFIRQNYSTRLLAGFAAAVVEGGYKATTIIDVCSRAAVSRRTFYEQFSSLEKTAQAMIVAAVSDEALASLEDVPRMEPESGLGATTIAIVAGRIAGEDDDSPPVATQALATVHALRERFAGDS